MKQSYLIFNLQKDLDSNLEGRIEITLYPGSPAPESRNPSSPQYAIPPEEDMTDYDIFINVEDQEFKLPNDLSESIFKLLEKRIATKIQEYINKSNEY